MKRTLLFAAIATILTLSGCANPYQKFYSGETAASEQPTYVPRNSPVQLFSTNDFERDRRDLARKGYVPIGQANFNAASDSVSERQLLEQADRVGAHLVLVSSQYSHTLSGAVPLTLPTTTTAQTTGNATIYSPGGMSTVNGTATTTTYGTRTVMMPYTVQRSDFSALFFAKFNPRVGIYTRPLDEASRQRLESNSGLIVDIVVEGSSAFLADVLPGDIILALAGQKAYSEESYIALLDANEGRTITFDLDRNGKRFSVPVEVRQTSSVATKP